MGMIHECLSNAAENIRKELVSKLNIKGVKAEKIMVDIKSDRLNIRMQLKC